MKKKECAKNLTFDTPSFAFFSEHKKVLIKFNLLTTNTLMASPKFAYLRPTARPSRISQAQWPKSNI